MPRLFLTAALLALFVLTLTSPSMARSKKNKYGWGLDVGVATTGAHGSYVTQDQLGRDNDSGIVAGIFAIWNINRNLSFQPMVQFVDKGFEFKGSGESNLVEIGIDTRYIEVPLMVHWEFSPRKYVSPTVFGGIVPGVLLDSQARVDFKQEGTRTAKVAIGNLNTFSLDIAAGGRLTFPARKDRAFLELRVQYGVRSFLSNAGVNGIPYDYSKQEVYLGATGDPDAHHFLFMMSVGFILD